MGAPGSSSARCHEVTKCLRIVILLVGERFSILACYLLRFPDDKSWVPSEGFCDFRKQFLLISWYGTEINSDGRERNLFSILVLLIIVYVCVTCIYEASHRLALACLHVEVRVSPWALRIKLRQMGLFASTLTCWTILVTQNLTWKLIVSILRLIIGKGKWENSNSSNISHPKCSIMLKQTLFT